jgi:hypothetical protein
VAATKAGLAVARHAARPELPFLLAGSIAFIGGVARAKGWPKNGFKATLAIGVLVIVASLTSGTSFAPLVRAVGLLMVLATSMATITQLGKK